MARPKKSKLLEQNPDTIVERHGFTGLCAMPTELFDEICGHLRPVDVLNLGCANKRLAVLTGTPSRLWTVFRVAMGYPAVPPSYVDQITDKKIVVLASRMGCFFCTTKGKKIVWSAMKRVCAKCTNKAGTIGVTELGTIDPVFARWCIDMESAKSTSTFNRKNQLAEIRANRRAEIIKRFGDLTPISIPLDWLEKCETFRKACEVPAPLTGRMFTNLLRTIQPELRNIRIRETIKDRYLALYAFAMEGIPAAWHRVFSRANLYSYGFYSESTPFEADFIDAIKPELEQYMWNQVYPEFDPRTFRQVAEAKKAMTRPFTVYEGIKAEILGELPGLQEEVVSYISANTPTYRALPSVVSAERAKSDFLIGFEEQVTEDRLDQLFPSDGGMRMGRIGPREWKDHNSEIISYRNKDWNLAQVRASVAEWNKTLTQRIATTYRRITETCSADIKSVGEVHANTENDIKELPEWEFLADMDVKEVARVHGILRSVFNYPFYMFSEQRHGQNKVSQCRQLITEPDDKFDAETTFEAIAEYVTSVMSNRRALRVHAEPVIYVAFLKSIGLDYRKDHETTSVAEYEEWERKLSLQVEGVLQEVESQEWYQNSHHFYNLEVDDFMVKMVSNAETCNDILPADEFSAKEFVENHSDWLESEISQRMDFFSHGGYDSEYDSDDDGLNPFMRNGCSLM
ncbi:hypothetical protein BDR26DRAFT_863341 [Obelidium mucronatum]|nr:hypothetical protein BDR26DRAFT_863341 [Obelidium mucronatum]